jgi:hypothetical protein
VVIRADLEALTVDTMDPLCETIFDLEPLARWAWGSAFGEVLLFVPCVVTEAADIRNAVWSVEPASASASYLRMSANL